VKTRSRTFKKVLTVVGLLVVIVGISLLLGSKKTEDILDYFRPFFQALMYVENEYYGKESIDHDKLLEGAIEGLLEGLDDPFAWYFSPEEAEESRIDTEAQYGGLGIVVEYDSQHKAIRVISPMVGSPAMKAGLQAGDLIITIDGTPVSTMGYWEAIQNLRGTPGEPVTIEVLRKGVDEPLVFTIVRERIELKTVHYDFLETKQGRVGYIRLTRFSRPTPDELRKVLNTVYDTGVKGLILDLRDNPGGLLDAAIEVASFFVDEGVIVKVKGSRGIVDVYRSYGNEYPNLPMVVVVNKGSASASEIVTAALRDNNIATVVGTTTYGKAAVQRVFPLYNGGELWLPIAHYFTPSGEDIHMKGVKPQITVESTITTQIPSAELTITKMHVEWRKDPYLVKAVEVLEEKIHALEVKP